MAEPRARAYRDVLAVPGARALIGASAASQIGNWLYNAALLGYVYSATHSAGWVGAATICRLLPHVLLGPFGGVVADRYSRRSVLLAGDALRLLVMAAIAATVAAAGPVALVIAFTPVASAAGCAEKPAAMGLLPRLVGETRLGPANALLHTVQDLGVVIGPAIGAILLGVAPAWVAFLANGATFAVSAVLISTMRPDPAPARGYASGVAQLAGGLRTVRATEFLADIRRLDAQLREANLKLAAAVRGSGTSLTGIFGVGPVIAGTVIGDVRQVFRFPGRDHFAAYNGTAPVEVSSGGRKVYRLSLRGNRRLNHAIHMAAITQISHKHSDGRAYYDKKIADGKTHKEALRCLKRRISDAIYAALVADARRASDDCAEGPGGQPGNHSVSRAAGSHPAHRLFGQATPGPGHHPMTAASTQNRAGHSSVAAPLPSAKPQVQVERPQRSEDERPGGTARRRPYSAARKAPMGPRTRPAKPQLRTNPGTTA